MLDELAAAGISADFDHYPVRALQVFDPAGRVYPCRSTVPLLYLVRRGASAACLDRGLSDLAIAAAVDIHYAVEVPPCIRGILAGGSRGGNIVAVGHVFEADSPDGIYAVVNDNLAPKGYAYLLIVAGQGTVASCLFSDFANSHTCLERSVAFFQMHVGFTMQTPRRLGGAGNYAFPVQARAGELLAVGEAAGFQDPLFGFGIRYVMRSGVLAAALLAGEPDRYAQDWRSRLGGDFRVGVVNRYAYERLGNLAYGGILRTVAAVSDVRFVAV